VRPSCSELLARGDLAAKARDFAALAVVARLLSTQVGDPLGDALLDLSRACYARHGRPTASWHRLRRIVAHRLVAAGT